VDNLELYNRLHSLSQSFGHWQIEVRSKLCNSESDRDFTHMHQTLAAIVREVFESLNTGKR